MIDFWIDLEGDFDRFFVDVVIGNQQQIVSKPIKTRYEKSNVILDGSCGGLWDRLGGKLGPSWHQNRTKWDTKTMSKNHQKSGDARVRKDPQGNRTPGP